MKATIENHRRQRMKENLNQLTEIYSKKPVKAGGKYSHSRVGSDSIDRDADEVVLLPEIR